jgi:hypothetical protein
MSEPLPRYRREDGSWLIEIELRRVSQLFNSFDPSPFHERDLDDDAETWIVGAARELPLGAPLKLVLHLPATELTIEAEEQVRSALSSYFTDRAAMRARDLSYLFHRGRIALVIGLAFLTACLVSRGLLIRFGAQGWPEIASEGLLIVGWVAMWRPLEIFLYDWWPLRRMVLLNRKLAAMPIELRARQDR